MSGMSMSMDTTNDQSLSFAPHSNSTPTPHRFSNVNNLDENLSANSNVKVTNELWDLEEARSTLRSATIILSTRGLKMASRWAAEQLNSLAPSNDDEQHGTTNVNENKNANQRVPLPSHPMNTSQVSSELQSAGNDLEMYAKAIFDLGEYQRAAAILSVNPDGNRHPGGTGGLQPTGRKRVGTKGGDLNIHPPLQTLTSYGIYLRAYALYMAGERRKEEEVLELR